MRLPVAAVACHRRRLGGRPPFKNRARALDLVVTRAPRSVLRDQLDARVVGAQKRAADTFGGGALRRDPKRDGLAQSALRSIERTFQKRAVSGLLSSRSGLLPTTDETPKADAGDWELVTWLVVMDSKA